jgi:DNA-directed RNA polymerase subunit RPC12/RpoP
MVAPKKGVKCPRCGGKVVEVVYGLPRPEVEEQDGRLDAAIGRGIVSSDNPSHRCTVCGEEFCWEEPSP